MTSDIAGYMHPAYAASFEEIATPRELAHCGGWILARPIRGSGLQDGMGCYPLFTCRDWSRLPDDLEALSETLVSLTLVTDPFGHYRVEDLEQAFDVVRLYKHHYVTDLAEAARPATRRHKRNTAKAMEALSLSQIDEPMAYARVWVELYGQLVERHRLTGLHAFSARCLERQLSVPGLRMFSASAEGHVVGLHLWYVQGEVAYGHLGATSARGLELMASYALYDFAMARLRSEARWLSLGGSPGRGDDTENGLSRFKKGWATGTRPVYLCGKVLQPEEYKRLTAGDPEPSEYFPAYRYGELAS